MFYFLKYGGFPACVNLHLNNITIKIIISLAAKTEFIKKYLLKWSLPSGFSFWMEFKLKDACRNIFVLKMKNFVIKEVFRTTLNFKFKRKTFSQTLGSLPSSFDFLPLFLRFSQCALSWSRFFSVYPLNTPPQSKNFYPKETFQNWNIFVVNKPKVKIRNTIKIVYYALLNSALILGKWSKFCSSQKIKIRKEN